MLYGEKVKYARKKLGLSRMKFAVMLGMTEGSIRNIEICKDESIKLSYDRMKKIIDIAELPKGYFFYDADEISVYLQDNIEVFSRGKDKVTDEEAKELATIAESLK